MIYFCIDLFVCIFEVLVYKRFLNSFIGRQKVNDGVSFGSLFALASIWAFVGKFNIPILNFACMLLVFILYITEYDSRVRHKVVLVLLYVGVGFLVEPIGYVVLQLLKETEASTDLRYYFVMILSTVFRAIIVEVFCIMKRKKDIYAEHLPEETTYVLVSVPAISIVCCCLLIKIVDINITSEIAMLCMAVMIAIILCNYLIFYMMHRYSVLMREKHESELFIKEQKFNEDFYNEIQENFETIQGIRHNIKNQLLGIRDTLEQAGGVKAKEKLDEICGELDNQDDWVITSNAVINSILKSKVNIAKRHDIRMEIKIQVPMELSADCGDIGILYGNLLDNAIEASSNVPVHKRYIYLESKFKDRSLLLKIINSKAPDQNSDLVTTKKDKKRHGRGIQSVRKIVDKYNGVVLFQDKKDYFEVTAALNGVELIK